MISNERVKHIFAGNGASKKFQIPFDFFQNEAGEFDKNNQIAVIKVSTTGTETVLTEDTDYEVETWGPSDSGSSGYSGYVILNTAPAVGEKLVIMRDVPLVQQLDLEAGKEIGPVELEAALDKIVMTLQQLHEKLGRAICYRPSTSDGQIDAAAYLANFQQLFADGSTQVQEATATAISACQEYANTCRQNAAQTAQDLYDTANRMSTAITAANNAASANTAAQAAKEAAQEYQASAAASAASASADKTAAQTAKEEAENAKALAVGYKDAALSAKTDALAYKNAAQESATNAETYKNAAVSAKDEAVAAKNLAQEYKTDAQTAKTNAQTYSTQAQSAKEDTVAAKDIAVSAKTDAATSATTAQTILDEIRTRVHKEFHLVAGTANATCGYTGSLTEFEIGIDMSALAVEVHVDGILKTPENPTQYSISNTKIVFATAVTSGKSVVISLNGNLPNDDIRQASENVQGIIQIANATEATAGTDNTKAMTAQKTASLITAHNASNAAHSDIRTAITTAQNAAVSTAGTNADSKVSTHNSSDSAHSDIRTAITTAQTAAVTTAGTNADTKITAHNESAQAHSDIRTLIAGKQDALTAGSNVSIDANGVISATNTTYTAGSGITINGTVISASASGSGLNKTVVAYSTGISKAYATGHFRTNVGTSGDIKFITLELCNADGTVWKPAVYSHVAYGNRSGNFATIYRDIDTKDFTETTLLDGDTYGYRITVWY